LPVIQETLIIRGARQVGKTWLVERFASEQFSSFVKIDLEERSDLHFFFDGKLDPQNILQHLELETERIIPGKTLLFLDEIQPCPRAIY
jgi:predicted AAA+ superfamily ATPase